MIGDDDLRPEIIEVDLTHPEDRDRDERLVKDQSANAANSTLFGHREHLTAIENEEDGVPDDEDPLEEAGQNALDAEASKPSPDSTGSDQ